MIDQAATINTISRFLMNNKGHCQFINRIFLK